MTEDIDELTALAETSYREVTEHTNLGLKVWTERVFEAASLLPKLVTTINELRTDLITARAQQGGHLEAVIDPHETRVVCSTCRTVISKRATDIRQVG